MIFLHASFIASSEKGCTGQSLDVDTFIAWLASLDWGDSSS
jgi:hypothetical protein